MAEWKEIEAEEALALYRCGVRGFEEYFKSWPVGSDWSSSSIFNEEDRGLLRSDYDWVWLKDWTFRIQVE